MPELVLSLGSNIDAAQNIRLAVHQLELRFGEGVRSSVFQSAAVGFEGEDFLNLVAVFECEDSLNNICTTIKQIETGLGRTRNSKGFSPRPINIDVLLFGEQSGDDRGIKLPRDEITRYAFVLQPLAELLPDKTHPITKQSYSAMWNCFEDKSQRLEAIKFDWG